jgi:hypothetical protein
VVDHFCAGCTFVPARRTQSRHTPKVAVANGLALLTGVAPLWIWY